MAIDVIIVVQYYNGGFLPDILPLILVPIVVRFDGTIMVFYYYYPFQYIYVLQHCLLFCFVWLPCLTINNASVQYNGGLQT